MPLITIATVCLVLGVVLLLWGRAGRRLDDHPVCRGCRFDLVGVWATDQTDTLCPECGTDLGDRGAVRVGNRRRRGGAMVTGGVCLVAAMVVGALGVTRSVSTSQLYAWAPTWFLASELLAMDADRAPLAAGELDLRILDQSLAGEPLVELVDRILDTQLAARESGGRWLSELGDVVLSARGAGHLDDERMVRFIQQSASFTPGGRSSVHEGAMWINTIGTRAPFGPSHDLAIASLTPNEVRFVPIDDQGRPRSDRPVEPEPPLGPSRMFSQLGGGSSGSVGIHQTIGRPPGRYRVETDWRIGLHADFAAAARDDAEPIGLVEVTLSHVLEIVDADVQLVRLVPDPALKDDVRAAIEISNARVEAWDAGAALNMTLMVREAPVAVAFDVFLLPSDSAETTLEPMRAWSGIVANAGANQGTGVGVQLDSLEHAERVLGGPGRPVRIRLTSSREQLLRSSSEIEEAWAGALEFVIEQVAWPDPSVEPGELE
ncbi:MAG: hypothetical protein AAGK04_08190 [Planctomycetota bacterium]